VYDPWEGRDKKTDKRTTKEIKGGCNLKKSERGQKGK